MLRILRQHMGARVRALFVALLLATGLTGLAQAQDVLVMNEARILRESSVGQHIASRIETIGNEINAELAPIRQQIQAESEALNAETSSLTEEAIQQRPDLMQRFQALQAQAQQFEQLRELRQQEISVTERRALAPVMQALQSILQDIVNERGATVLLDRSNVVYAADSIDISASAIDRLNQRMSTTPVNRVRLSVNEAGEVQITEDQ